MSNYLITITLYFWKIRGYLKKFVRIKKNVAYHSVIKVLDIG